MKKALVLGMCLASLTAGISTAESAQKPQPAAPAPAAKAAPAAPAKDQGQPTRITSQKMTYAHDARTVTFEGEVFVDRGDMQVWAERLVAHISAAKADAQAAGGAAPAGTSAGPADDLGASSIEKIEAFGKVRIKREEKQGTCDKAVWDVPAGVVTMTGNPVLSEGANSIKGHTVVFRLKENKSEVLAAPAGDKSGQPGKVEAFFLSPKGNDPAQAVQGKAKQ